MRVTTAKSAGFCFGVKRAVDMVYEHAGNGNVYTYGPVIHNEEVVNDLTRRGVKVLETPEDIKKAPKGTVIINMQCDRREAERGCRDCSGIGCHDCHRKP